MLFKSLMIKLLLLKSARIPGIVFKLQNFIIFLQLNYTAFWALIV